ncbi:MAG: universal stress protein [Acidimicrobiales bacterium]
MFTNIVVGTDGSNTAGLAVALAADLARQHGAVLHLVNAYKVPNNAAVGLAGPTVVTSEEMSAEAFMDASKRVLAEAAKAAGAEKVESHSAVGSAADVLIDVAEATGADLIVVGSKGMRGARRMMGSVPNTVAHRAPCHVLVAKTA